MNSQVRIQSIKIHNFKSIEEGNIRLGTIDYFADEDDQVLIHDVLGVYGPNGTGKSAFIEACGMIRNLLTHGKLPSDFVNYIREPDNECSLEIEFLAKVKSGVYLIGYKVRIKLSKSQNLDDADTFEIVEESLTSKMWNEEEKKFNPRLTLCQLKNGGFGSSSSSIFDKDTRSKLAGSMYMRPEDSCFFSESAQGIIHDAKPSAKDLTKASKLNLLKEIIPDLVQFAKNQWMILMNRDYGEWEFFQILPLNVMVNTENEYLIGKIPLISESSKTSMISESLYPKLVDVIDQMNIVLRELIPHLELKIKETRQTFDKKGNAVVEFESGTQREDVFIPLRYESDGIKRIISILEAIIVAVNNPFTCIMIDELDAGIFEYLLGEIVKVLSEITKGQMLFTAHNLHVFEKMSYKKIYVTTTNPMDRFVQLKNIKATNNFRDSYYRTLVLSADAKTYMDPIKQSRIRRAFKKAGHFYEEK